ncbi:MAG: hypothetical protein HQL53_14065, partial [Magnetococcales bacterium]|nr:hypothetical protein [Magnetococcales bacterium]
MIVNHDARHTRWILAAVLGLTAAIHLPEMLSLRWVPYHDTMQTYMDFHNFYSEFRHTGQLALWQPYGNFGIGLDLILWTALTPFAALSMALGLLVGASDTLLLFKLAV